jgi:hypothetical protein
MLPTDRTVKVASEDPVRNDGKLSFAVVRPRLAMMVRVRRRKFALGCAEMCNYTDSALSSFRFELFHRKQMDTITNIFLHYRLNYW